jgi:dolichol-phosphate mannosyltransferase
MKTALFIPCFNEEDNIYNLLEHCKKYISKEDIYVLDNNSTDNTCNMASLAGVNIRRNHQNMGIGGSLCYNLQYVPSGYTNVITMDAGWSHDPDDIPLFFKYPYMCTIGYREHWKAPLKRKLLTLISRKVLNCRFHTDIDWTSGFRNYTTDALRELKHSGWFNKPHAKGHAFQFEIAVALDRQGDLIADVPITFHSSNRSLNWRVLWEALITYWKL